MGASRRKTLSFRILKHPIFAQRVSHLSAFDKADVRPCVPGCAHTVVALRARIFELERAPRLKQPRGGALTLKTG